MANNTTNAIHTSVIIPSRNEQYLQKTIDDLFEKSADPKALEVIAVLDGYWPEPFLKENPNLVILHHGIAHGLRDAVNMGAQIAHGKYLMKVDAHCMFEKNFDAVLSKDCEKDWLCIPRRASLDPIKWERAITGRAPVDYEYISYPYREYDVAVRQSNVWGDRAKQRRDILIDDDMSFQGSCWYTHRDYFINKIGPLQEEGYGTFVLEPEELGNKVWLSGGRVVINKNTMYCHWHKGRDNGRGYFIDRRQLIRGRRYHIDFWMNNKWMSTGKQVYPYEWLIDKFWPVPTWPEDWKTVQPDEAKLHGSYIY